MSWTVPIERSQKSRVLLAYSNPSRNRKKTAKHSCLMRRLGYSVFAADIASYAEIASKQTIRACLLISLSTELALMSPSIDPACRG
jgi:hypothetical protein